MQRHALALILLASVFQTACVGEVSGLEESDPGYQTASTRVGTASFAEVLATAATVRQQIEAARAVPAQALVGGTPVDKPTLLRALVQLTLQIKSGSREDIALVTYAPPTRLKDTSVQGRISQAEYLHIASDVAAYMDQSGKSPDYAYQTSLGKYLSFDNLIYMYAMTGQWYGQSGKLADWAQLTVFSKRGLTMAGLGDTAARARYYIETIRALPPSIATDAGDLNMATLLKMLVTATLQIADGTADTLAREDYPLPTAPRDSTLRGRVPRAEFLQIARDVKAYMESSGRTPDYAYRTSLGEFMSFDNLVYMYSMVIAHYYKSGGSFADWAELTVFSRIDVGTIMQNAARYGYCGTCQDAGCMMSVGCGSCWAMSDYLCNELAAAHIPSRVLQYATSMAGNHRSVQYLVDGNWTDVPYKAYGLDYRFSATSSKSGAFLQRNCY